MGKMQFCQTSHPATDANGYSHADGLSGFLLDFFTYCLDPAFKFFILFTSKKNTDPAAAFLVCNACILTAYDLITDIEKHKGHQLAFLSLVCFNLEELGIGIQVKDRYLVGLGIQMNPQPFQLIKAFLNIPGAGHKPLDRSGPDHQCVVPIILRGTKQRIHLLPGPTLLINLLFYSADHFPQFHSSNRLKKIFTHTILDSLLGIFKFSKPAKNHNKNIWIFFMKKLKSTLYIPQSSARRYFLRSPSPILF